MPTTRRWQVIAVVYVAVVVALAAMAFSSDHDGFDPVEAAAFALALPAVIPGLPVIYVAGGLAWNVTGAPDNGPIWPVAVTFAITIGGCAATNVWLICCLAERRDGRRRRLTGMPGEQ